LGWRFLAVVLLVVLLVSLAAGLAAWLVFRHWPQADPALSTTEAIGRKLRSDHGPRRFWRSRIDPATATGLVLTVALAGLVLSGAIVGVLAWMIRRGSGLVNIDRAIDVWADEHATAFSDQVLAGITHLGDTATIIAIGVAISAYGVWRWRKPTIPLFVVSVVLGQILISNTIKVVVDRADPSSARARTSPGRRSRAVTRPPRLRRTSPWRWCLASPAPRGPVRRSQALRLRSAWPSDAHGFSLACIGSPTRWPGS
jgi:hypothetical protein